MQVHRSLLTNPNRRVPRRVSARLRLWAPICGSAGCATQAGELLCEAVNLGEAGAQTAILALGILALMDLKGSRLDAAAARIRDGLALMDRCDLQECVSVTGLWAARAWLNVERGEHARAESDLARVVSRLPLTAAMPWWSICLGVVAGRAARGLHQFDQAESLLAQARNELARYPGRRRAGADAQQ